MFNLHDFPSDPERCTGKLREEMSKCLQRARENQDHADNLKAQLKHCAEALKAADKDRKVRAKARKEKALKALSEARTEGADPAKQVEEEGEE